MPDIDFMDDEWKKFERPEHHQGVLTAPAFLFRFASDRSRANHVYTQLLCQPFTPPSDGIPAKTMAPDPNLRKREGCANCHSRLEPAAGHWKNWRILNTYGFRDSKLYEVEESCLCGGSGEKKCSNLCNTYYITGTNSDAETYESFGGLPIAAAYASGDEKKSMDLGPRGLWDRDERRTQLSECVVRKYSKFLLGRPLGIDDFLFLEEEGKAFRDSGNNFRKMVKRLIQSEKYSTLR